MKNNHQLTSNLVKEFDQHHSHNCAFFFYVIWLHRLGSKSMHSRMNHGSDIYMHFPSGSLLCTYKGSNRCITANLRRFWFCKRGRDYSMAAFRSENVFCPSMPLFWHIHLSFRAVGPDERQKDNISKESRRGMNYHGLQVRLCTIRR
jgi:hypothetical protein